MVILGEICLVFEFSYRFTLAFGHSFSKFIYSLSLHKFIKKTSPLQEKNTIKGIFFLSFLDKIFFINKKILSAVTRPLNSITALSLILSLSGLRLLSINKHQSLFIFLQRHRVQISNSVDEYQ